MADSGQAFIDRSCDFLEVELLPRIEACVRQLPEEDLWWRPNEASNSVGNLMLHLAGNVRQWIVAGVGEAPDKRDRQLEFDQRDPIPGDELLHRLATTVHEAVTVLTALSPAVLLDTRTIQGRSVTVLAAIYHVVEHFSMHTGQIAYITKLRLSRDLGFYRMDGDVAHATWRAPDAGSSESAAPPPT